VRAHVGKGADDMLLALKEEVGEERLRNCDSSLLEPFSEEMIDNSAVKSAFNEWCELTDGRDADESEGANERLEELKSELRSHFPKVIVKVLEYCVENDEWSDFKKVVEQFANSLPDYNELSNKVGVSNRLGKMMRNAMPGLIGEDLDEARSSLDELYKKMLPTDVVACCIEVAKEIYDNEGEDETSETTSYIDEWKDFLGKNFSTLVCAVIQHAKESDHFTPQVDLLKEYTDALSSEEVIQRIQSTCETLAGLEDDDDTRQEVSDLLSGYQERAGDQFPTLVIGVVSFCLKKGDGYQLCAKKLIEDFFDILPDEEIAPLVKGCWSNLVENDSDSPSDAAREFLETIENDLDKAKKIEIIVEILSTATKSKWWDDANQVIESYENDFPTYSSKPEMQTLFTSFSASAKRIVIENLSNGTDEAKESLAKFKECIKPKIIADLVATIANELIDNDDDDLSETVEFVTEYYEQLKTVSNDVLSDIWRKVSRVDSPTGGEALIKLFEKDLPAEQQEALQNRLPSKE
jgi:hypothetical protein